MQSAEDSLRRLQVDTIDLYQSHWDDDKTPLEETLEAIAPPDKVAAAEAGRPPLNSILNTDAVTCRHGVSPILSGEGFDEAMWVSPRR